MIPGLPYSCQLQLMRAFRWRATAPSELQRIPLRGSRDTHISYLKFPMGSIRNSRESSCSRHFFSVLTTSFVHFSILRLSDEEIWHSIGYVPVFHPLCEM